MSRHMRRTLVLLLSAAVIAQTFGQSVRNVAVGAGGATEIAIDGANDGGAVADAAQVLAQSGPVFKQMLRLLKHQNRGQLLSLLRSLLVPPGVGCRGACSSPVGALCHVRRWAESAICGSCCPRRPSRWSWWW